MSKRNKYTLEVAMKSSPGILYNYLITPSGLSEWFCDDVDVKTGQYIFKWDGSEQVALVLRNVNNKLIRYRWMDGPEDEYFEMEITVDDLTGDVALNITDFCDAGDEKSSMALWESQIQQLKMAIGS